jgi:glycosyltransferase involved in cell wall biosynthesis
MKVLFVIHHPVYGGPHNQAFLLAQALDRLGVSMVVLLPEEHGNAAGRLRDAGVEVVTTELHRMRASFSPVDHLRFTRTLRREIGSIRKIIREAGADVVQIGGLVNPHGAVAGRREGKAVVWQLVDTRAPMFLRRLMMPLVTRVSDVVMTTGAAVADVHPGARALGNRLREFYPPVDIDSFTPSRSLREAGRSKFGFGPGDVVLGTVGNLNPQKGHEYFLRAAALVRSEGVNVKLLVVGASHPTHEGYERALRELAGQLGLEMMSDLVFAGGLEDVRPALAAMDLFVLSSVPRSEGAPTVVEEAMTMCLPVVASNVGAVAELVEDGVTGFLVPPLSPDEMAKAILTALENPDGCRAMGSEGRTRALERFSVDACARAHLDAYDLAVQHSRSRKSVRHS